MSVAEASDKATLLDRVTLAYAFTDADKVQLAHLLATSYLTAKVSAYRRAEATAAHVLRLKHPWQPSSRDAQSAQDKANEWVESIAATYETMLRNHLEQTYTPLDRSLWSGIGDAIKNVGAWFADMVDWKSEQIANVTLGTGGYDGTSEWIEDVIAESESGDLTGEGDPNGVRVRVVPDSSSSDICSDFAGQDYSLEEASDLPEFPIHPRCPHQIEVYVV